MAMYQLGMRNFKCFKEEQKFNLNKLTIFTGNNGAGKSTVLQALLLLRSISEHEKKEKISIPLNQEPRLRLGSFDEIINDENIGNIGISLNDFKVNLELDYKEQEDEEINLEIASIDLSTSTEMPQILSRKEFYYLNAERIGPRLDARLKRTEYLNCLDQGEATGSVLIEAEKQGKKVMSFRSKDRIAKPLNIATDEWMSYIFGEVSIKPQSLSSDRYTLKIKQPDQRERRSTNTGFGYTYVLPIIVNGLVAEEGSFYIVENPEAHLHPKAQSRVGFFLGQMAASGLNVIIETHSEHVISGVRLAALSSLGLSHEEIDIYFFSSEPHLSPYVHIKVDEDGDLSDFPIDFFDQVRQDMLELMNLAKDK